MRTKTRSTSLLQNLSVAVGKPARPQQSEVRRGDQSLHWSDAHRTGLELGLGYPLLDFYNSAGLTAVLVDRQVIPPGFRITAPQLPDTCIIPPEDAIEVCCRGTGDWRREWPRGKTPGHPAGGFASPQKQQSPTWTRRASHRRCKETMVVTRPPLFWIPCATTRRN